MGGSGNAERGYGMSPHHLPKSMVRVVRAEAGSGRLLKWVGREGVTLLDFGRDREYECASLGRFPRKMDGTVDWSRTPEELVLAVGEYLEIEALVDRFMAGSGSYVFLWGTLTLPSVEVSGSALAVHLREIVERIPEFWIYSPDRSVLLENLFSGEVRVAGIPG